MVGFENPELEAERDKQRYHLAAKLKHKAEVDLDKAYRIIGKQFQTIIVLIILLVGSNLAWWIMSD